MWKRIRTVIVVLLLAGGVTVLVHNVPSRLTKKDRAALSGVYAGFTYDADRLQTDFDYQVEIIRHVQSTAMALIHKGHGIPLNERRDPASAVEAGEGECYDRSRFIEQSLRYFGLPARHLSIYVNTQGIGPLRLLASGGTHSHALSEVRTVKGWMIVDSNFEWLALDAEGEPLCFCELDDDVQFLEVNPQTGVDLYTTRNLGVYGLYSRHGRFFRPFDPIPDYSLRELWYNL